MSIKQAPLDFIRSRYRVDPDTGCWRWTGTINYAGYGRCAPWWLDHHVRAHRLSYEMFVGPIPEGMTVDHLCYVRDCINPDHLEVCTVRENILRGKARARRLRVTTESDSGSHPGHETPLESPKRPDSRSGAVAQLVRAGDS